MNRAQMNLLDEIIVDNFAGGGGASTGIELATGRVVDIAVNHDPDAILMHKTNHPHTVHYQASVWDVDPEEVCAGRPVVWPEPTHAPADSEEVKAGRKKPWRSASEIIDWSLPCPSIFDTREEVKEKYGLIAQRPLRPNTMRRVARGVDKFVIKAANPFIVPMGYGEAKGQAPRVHDIQEPFPTAVGKAKHGVCQPYMAPLTMHNNENATGTAITEPVNTITGTGAGGHQMLITPTLAAIGQTGGGDRCRSVEEPTHTQVSKAEECVVCPAMIQYHTEQTERVRGQAVTDPIMTIDASNRYGIAAASLAKYYGNDQHGQDAEEPMHTITAKDREAVTMASLAKFYGGVVGAPVLEPVPTVTAVDHNALQTAHMVKMKGTNLGGPVQEPVQTITASGTHHGLVITKVEKAAPGADLQRWPLIREALNKYCDYHLADNEVILFLIDGAWYFMADIGLRMLTPAELYRANGFPTDYIIERDYQGNTYGKTKQVARCGNAVPPPFATALVRANFPEWCDQEITTMAQLERAVAV